VTEKNNQRQAAIPDEGEAEKNKLDLDRRRADEEVRRLTERLALRDHQVAMLEQSANAGHQLTRALLASQARLESENEALRATIADLQSGAHGGPPDASSGVVVTLPHVTHTFEIVFDVYREYWPPRDPGRPPKSANVAHAIDARLGWTPHRNGSPSRSAQAFAAAMRPDALSASDGRNQKRRLRSGLPPRRGP
jgi:hypothetical protein